MGKKIFCNHIFLQSKAFSRQTFPKKSNATRDICLVLEKATRSKFIIILKYINCVWNLSSKTDVKGTFLWGDMDQVQWSKITQIIVHQRNRWIRDQNGFIGSFDVPWSEWSWITDPDPDHPSFPERTLTFPFAGFGDSMEMCVESTGHMWPVDAHNCGS